MKETLLLFFKVYLFSSTMKESKQIVLKIMLHLFSINFFSLKQSSHIYNQTISQNHRITE